MTPTHPSPYNPTAPLHPGRSHLGWHASPQDKDTPRHFRDWLDHLEAGRIGGNPPCPPEVAARRTRNEAVLRRVLCP